MIRNLLLAILLLSVSTFTVSAQKSKVLATFQLIETEKYKEAKEAIEEALTEKSTKNWSWTWYARGMLAQKAYEKGMKENDKKKYELYPDQLNVAYESYDKALKLDNRGRLNDQIAPNYVLLANDFKQQAEKNFKRENYDKAANAFENALKINKSKILSVKLDSNLIYNTALSAYLAKDWDKANTYFNALNENNYSPNIPLLLATGHLEKEDTLSAKNVLSNAINRYDENRDLVLLLADLHYKTDDTEEAIALLDSIGNKKPDMYIYPYTKGLIYQKSGDYKPAIEAYEEALKSAPDTSNARIYSHIGSSYYNIGVEIQQNARTIASNRIYQREKEKASAAFKSALKAYEKAYEKNPNNEELSSKLNRLYDLLDIQDKITGL
jgi:tetratricopeptide (TPR) repeat protein